MNMSYELEYFCSTVKRKVTRQPLSKKLKLKGKNEKTQKDNSRGEVWGDWGTSPQMQEAKVSMRQDGHDAADNFTNAPQCTVKLYHWKDREDWKRISALCNVPSVNTNGRKAALTVCVGKTYQVVGVRHGVEGSHSQRVFIQHVEVGVILRRGGNDLYSSC